MTLKSTETCFSISTKRDSILSITPSTVYLITITPFKVLHYCKTVCSRQCRFSTTTWYTVLQVPSKMMNFWSMPWLCTNEWFHHKNLVSPLYNVYFIALKLCIDSGHNSWNGWFDIYHQQIWSTSNDANILRIVPASASLFFCIHYGTFKRKYLSSLYSLLPTYQHVVDNTITISMHT